MTQNICSCIEYKIIMPKVDKGRLDGVMIQCKKCGEEINIPMRLKVFLLAGLNYNTKLW